VALPPGGGVDGDTEARAPSVLDDEPAPDSAPVMDAAGATLGEGEPAPRGGTIGRVPVTALGLPAGTVLAALAPLPEAGGAGVGELDTVGEVDALAPGEAVGVLAVIVRARAGAMPDMPGAADGVGDGVDDGATDGDDARGGNGGGVDGSRGGPGIGGGGAPEARTGDMLGGRVGGGGGGGAGAATAESRSISCVESRSFFARASGVLVSMLVTSSSLGGSAIGAHCMRPGLGFEAVRSLRPRKPWQGPGAGAAGVARAGGLPRVAALTGPFGRDSQSWTMEVAMRSLGVLGWVVMVAGCAADGSRGARGMRGEPPAVDDDGGPAHDAGASTSPVSAGSDPCGDGIDGNGDGQIDEGCPCAPGDVQPCFAGDPALASVGECRAGVQHCTGSAEFGEWGACEGAVGPAAELCGNGADDDCNGAVDEGCCASTEERCYDGVDDDCDGVPDDGCPPPVDVGVDLDGDCLTASCPPEAPYPVGCDITMAGGDSRGCVASSPTRSTVYFQEGDRCGVGRVTGTLRCASVPGPPLDATNCRVNKPSPTYPADRSGCPAT